MDVSQAIKQRISTRGFLDKQIPKDEIAAWLSDAQRAPSGGNLQPWRVIAIAGDEVTAVANLATEKLGQNPAGEPTDYPIYPDYITDAQNARRRAVGEEMYGKIGIPREDKVGRMVWFSKNFRFFDAKNALFIVMDERVGHGQWGHTGMFMQTLCLLAEERGWGTCMQECWGILRPSLKAHFGLGEHEMIWCGITVGYPDKSDPVNEIYTDRASLDEFAEFRGF